jgi:hypothetical protein
MYYVLECDYPDDDNDGYLDIDDGIDIDGIDSWSAGERFTVPVPNPIGVEAMPEGDYTGPPIEMHDGNLLLMSPRLVAALREAGVDNLDCYPAVIVNIETKKKYEYQAVNIIGLVAAADLGKSQWSSYDGDPAYDASFEGLTVRPEAARGALMFRLAENTGVILVHDKVKAHLLAKGLDTLTFSEPEDWVQL